MRLSPPEWIFAAALGLFLAAWATAPDDWRLGDWRPHQATALVAPELPLVEQVHTRTTTTTRSPELVHGFDHPFDVAFTFDDGPHPVQTERLLDVLEEFQAPATFFVNGVWLDEGRASYERNRDLVRRAKRAGHAVGNHTYGHELLSRLTPDAQTWQIVANEVLVSTVIGERMRLFRPPYGRMTDHAANVLRAYGYVATLWNATAADQELRDPEEIARTVLGWIRKYQGGIVLLHDRHAWSVDAMRLVLTRLERENCERRGRGQPIYRYVPVEAFLRPATASDPLSDELDRARLRQEERLAERCDGSLETRRTK